MLCLLSILLVPQRFHVFASSTHLQGSYVVPSFHTPIVPKRFHVFASFTHLKGSHPLFPGIHVLGLLSICPWYPRDPRVRPPFAPDLVCALIWEASAHPLPFSPRHPPPHPPPSSPSLSSPPLPLKKTVYPITVSSLPLPGEKLLNFYDWKVFRGGGAEEIMFDFGVSKANIPSWGVYENLYGKFANSNCQTEG